MRTKPVSYCDLFYVIVTELADIQDLLKQRPPRSAASPIISTVEFVNLVASLLDMVLYSLIMLELKRLQTILFFKIIVISKVFVLVIILFSFREDVLYLPE